MNGPGWSGRVEGIRETAKTLSFVGYVQMYGEGERRGGVADG